ncbi:MAG: hypothetical protein ACI8Y7_000910 [Candidatus Woesearchaeota archaeon]|jgi:hypothetical protein
MYYLFLDKKVVTFLSKQSISVTKRLFDKMNKLKLDPYPSDAKRVVNV